ncbi:hypothetical protein TNCV_845292 [Trichonephila clavipes]|nr:hypothetical protein TNCV_845292 [Trichonephila clavipes]
MRPPNDHVPYSSTSFDSPQFYSSKSPDRVIPDASKSADFVLPVEIYHYHFQKTQKSNIETGKLDLL